MSCCFWPGLWLGRGRLWPRCRLRRRFSWFFVYRISLWQNFSWLTLFLLKIFLWQNFSVTYILAECFGEGYIYIYDNNNTNKRSDLRKRQLPRNWLWHHRWLLYASGWRWKNLISHHHLNHHHVLYFTAMDLPKQAERVIYTLPGIIVIIKTIMIITTTTKITITTLSGKDPLSAFGLWPTQAVMIDNVIFFACAWYTFLSLNLQIAYFSGVIGIDGTTGKMVEGVRLQVSFSSLSFLCPSKYIYVTIP